MIIREDQDDIAVIRMAHGKVNAMDTAFCTALAAEVTSLGASAHSAVIITGSGGTFSAGVDLRKFLAYTPEEAQAFLHALDLLWRTVMTLPKPVVAEVNGHALAGGCLLAASCDLRVTSATSGRIGVPELLVGVPFPSVPWELTAARVSPHLLRRVVFLGETFVGQDAVAAGLADEASPPEQLHDRALDMARRLAAIPAASFHLMKDAINGPLLARANASAAHDARAGAGWSSAEVKDSIRRYLDQLATRVRV